MQSNKKQKQVTGIRDIAIWCCRYRRPFSQGCKGKTRESSFALVCLCFDLQGSAVLLRIEECTKCAFKGIIGDSISVVSDNNLCTSCQLIGNTINCNSGCIGLKAVPYIFAQGILVVLRNTRTLYTLIVYTKLKNHLNTPNCLYLSPRLYFCICILSWNLSNL